MLNLSLRRNLIASFLTGTFNGAFFSFQSGMSSSSAVVSKTFPESMWPPISALFSSTQMLFSCFFSLNSCASFIAADSPDGPPPTITTS